MAFRVLHNFLSIEQQAENLRRDYSRNGVVDFDRLCREHRINYYEHADFVVPFCGLDADGVTKNVFCFPYWTPGLKSFVRAQGFGHAVLGHCGNKEIDRVVMEAEAEHFAQYFSGINSNIGRALRDVFGLIEVSWRNPDASELVFLTRSEDDYTDILNKRAREIPRKYPK